MSNLLGYVRFEDDDKLAEIASDAGVELNHATVWTEARAEFENGASQAEVRIRNLDYVLIEKQ